MFSDEIEHKLLNILHTFLFNTIFSIPDETKLSSMFSIHISGTIPKLHSIFVINVQGYHSVTIFNFHVSIGT